MAKKIMMVVPPNDFDGQVFEAVRRALEGRGHTVAVTSLGSNATADDGMSVRVNVPIRNVKSYDYDAFVFIGGEGARILFDDPQARSLAKDVKYKTVGATGNAAVILALSEVLTNKKATCPHEYALWLTRHGARFTNQPLEVDEKIITLQDSALAEQFANAVAKAVE